MKRRIATKAMQLHLGNLHILSSLMLTAFMLRSRDWLNGREYGTEFSAADQTQISHSISYVPC